MNADSFRFDGKRAVIVGGATGMGAATAALVGELGGEVVVMDHVEVTTPGVKTIRVDLREPASIDAAVDECGGPIDALFSCAGAADGTPGIEKINFLGHRHLIDRVLAADLMPRGSSIAMISSAAARLGEEPGPVAGVPRHARLRRGVEWIAAHPGTADYMWSKQRSAPTSPARRSPCSSGDRINAILPGPTDTPLARSRPTCGGHRRRLPGGVVWRRRPGAAAARSCSSARRQRCKSTASR